MAKKSMVQSNERKKKLIVKYQAVRNELKEKIYDKTISMEERMMYIMKLSSTPRNSSKTRYRNRCTLTGRPRGFDRKTGFSRIAFRKFASMGLIPGVKKASW
jgi:small subunit ribosomal protein S14